MEKISWNDRMNNQELFHRVKKETNILHKIQWRKADWLNNIFHRNCFLKYVFGETIEGRGRRGRGRKQLLDDLKETRRHCKLKEKALTRTLLRIYFGEGHGPVAIQTSRFWFLVKEDPTWICPETPIIVTNSRPFPSVPSENSGIKLGRCCRFSCLFQLIIIQSFDAS